MDDLVFTCPYCGCPYSSFKEDCVDLHAGAGYRCDQCDGAVYFEAMTQEEYVAFSNQTARLHSYEAALRRMERWMRGREERCLYYVEREGKEANCGAKPGEPHDPDCALSALNNA